MARKIEVQVVGDSRSLERAFGRSQRSTSSLGRAFHGLGKTAKYAIGGGIGAGIVGLGIAVHESVGEFVQAQKATAQTNAVIKSTGGVANVTAKEVAKLSETLLKKTGIDDEAIQAGENMLLTFRGIRNEVGKGNDIFNQATKIGLDMSTALAGAGFEGGNLKTTMIRLGKALNDPVAGMTALKRVGVTFTEGQKKTIEQLEKTGRHLEAQKLILHELTLEFGGSAEAFGKTVPGQITILRESLKNLGAELVTKLLPTFKKFATFMTAEGLPAVEKFVRGIDFGAIFESLRAGVEIAINAFRGFMGTVRDAQSLLGPDVFQGLIVGLVGAAGVLGAITKVRKEMLAMAAIGASSGVLGLAFLSLAITLGAVAAVVLHNKRAADSLSDSYKEVANSARDLHSAEADLYQSQLDVEQAHIRQKLAADAVRHAQDAYNAAIDAGGPKSRAAIEASHNLAQAKHDLKQANLDAGNAEEDHRRKQRAANKEQKDIIETVVKAAHKQRDYQSSLGALNGMLSKVTGGLSKNSATYQDADDKARAWAKGMDKAADANRKAYPKVSRLQGAVADLARSLGRIPSDTEIRFMVRTMEFAGTAGAAHVRSDANRKARGGRIPGSRQAADSVPAYLSPGEFVVTGGGERMLEDMTFPGVLDYLQGVQPPHFAAGGRAAHGQKSITYTRLFQMLGGAGGAGGGTKGLVPQVLRALSWARGHGWAGSVTSGWRSYAEQAALYARYLAGGPLAAPPGHSSHESGQAVDVSQYGDFGLAMLSAPAGSRLFNRLGARDRVHYSVSGFRAGGRAGRHHRAPHTPDVILKAERAASKTYNVTDDISAYVRERDYIDRELARTKDPLTSAERKRLQARRRTVVSRLRTFRSRQEARRKKKEREQKDYSQLPAYIEEKISRARYENNLQNELAALLEGKAWLLRQLARKGLTHAQRAAIYSALDGIDGEIESVKEAIAAEGGEAAGGDGPTADEQATNDQLREQLAAARNEAALANAFVATGVFAEGGGGGGGGGGGAGERAGGGGAQIHFNFLVPDAEQIRRATGAIVGGLGGQGFRHPTRQRLGV